jgi:predicted lipid-binding transport protein (Tim44 family)
LAADFFKRFELALQEKYPESVQVPPSEAQKEDATNASTDSQAQPSGTPGWLWPLVAGVVAGLAIYWFTR